MRVYFEKPRTTVGWKGLINDPYLDESFRIDEGLRIARQLLLEINRLGMPAGSEFLDVITPQYIADLIAWGAIGARTTESQVHRELASGLSAPVGFKNGTDGNIRIAIDAIQAAARAAPLPVGAQERPGRDRRDRAATTTATSSCAAARRRTTTPASVAAACAEIEAAQLAVHADGRLQPRQQQQAAPAARSTSRATSRAQIAGGSRCIFGVMVESHLQAGAQKFSAGKDDPAQLAYGQSITDACLGWDDSRAVLRGAERRGRARRATCAEPSASATAAGRADAMTPASRRRAARRAAGAAAAAIACPAWRGRAALLPRMTDGPFYPSLSYRARALDWDADLTTVRGRAPTAAAAARRGEHLDLLRRGPRRRRPPIDGAEVEIWQCDAFGSYRHPRGAGARIDAGFQGFGSSRSDARGGYRFRTIRPVPYPGRTPHIHVKLRHPASASSPRSCSSPAIRATRATSSTAASSTTTASDVELRLQRAPAGEPVTWIAERDLLVGRPLSRVVGLGRVARQPLALPVHVVAAQAVEVGAVEHARQHEQQVATGGSGTGAASARTASAAASATTARSARRATVRPTCASAALRVPAGRMNSFSRGSAAL